MRLLMGLSGTSAEGEDFEEEVQSRVARAKKEKREKFFSLLSFPTPFQKQRAKDLVGVGVGVGALHTTT